MKVKWYYVANKMLQNFTKISCRLQNYRICCRWRFLLIFCCRMQKNLIFVVDSTFRWTPIAPGTPPYSYNTTTIGDCRKLDTRFRPQLDISDISDPPADQVKKIWPWKVHIGSQRKKDCNTPPPKRNTKILGKRPLF